MGASIGHWIFVLAVLFGVWAITFVVDHEEGSEAFMVESQVLGLISILVLIVMAIDIVVNCS